MGYWSSVSFRRKLVSKRNHNVILHIISIFTRRNLGLCIVDQIPWSKYRHRFWKEKWIILKIVRLLQCIINCYKRLSATATLNGFGLFFLETKSLNLLCNNPCKIEMCLSLPVQRVWMRILSVAINLNKASSYDWVSSQMIRTADKVIICR